MRRGGVLILLIGLILIVGAVALFLFLQPTGGVGGIGGAAPPRPGPPTRPPPGAGRRGRRGPPP
ncbi:MAG TPA: hypothetical protein PKD53_11515, partial [Chloroflexaceae bacterium]|nr:hypothetical protein [Chloroflexaceae bacterium]